VGSNETADRLLATCWTTAGKAAPYPGQHTSPIPLRTRIEAACRAGFTAFGVLDYDLGRFLENDTLPSLASLLADNGMDYVELEFLTQWWTTGPERERSDESRRLLFTAADALGAHHVKVAPDLVDVSRPDVDFWAEAFHELAVDAADHGTRVALEFMPFANISTLDQAVAVAQRADHPAAGLLVDQWHVQRSGLAPEAVASVPIDLLVAVELDDGTKEPVGDPYDDTCLRRLVPGEGDFPVASFAAALLRRGWNLPWGVEIISQDFGARDLDQSLPYLVARTREQLDGAHRLAQQAAH
jgi:sugar phosphate isomerase/epimerase